MTQKTIETVARELFEMRFQRAEPASNNSPFGEASKPYKDDVIATCQFWVNNSAVIFFDTRSSDKINPVGYMAFSCPQVYNISEKVGERGNLVGFTGGSTDPFMVGFSGSRAHSVSGPLTQRSNKLLDVLTASEYDTYKLTPANLVIPNVEFTELHKDLVRTASEYARLWFDELYTQEGQKFEEFCFVVEGKPGLMSSEELWRKEAGFYRETGFSRSFGLGSKLNYTRGFVYEPHNKRAGPVIRG